MRLISLIIGCLLWQTSFAQKSTLTTGGYALSSYDAVSYFEQDGPQKGLKNLQTNYKGAIYLFRSQAHLEAFQKNPAKYAPQYGGWCAYAIGVDGSKVKINPEAYRILDGKLYLFYKTGLTNTLLKWKADEASLQKKADQNWDKL